MLPPGADISGLGPISGVNPQEEKPELRSGYKRGITKDVLSPSKSILLPSFSFNHLP